MTAPGALALPRPRCDTSAPQPGLAGSQSAHLGLAPLAVGSRRLVTTGRVCAAGPLETERGVWPAD